MEKFLKLVDGYLKTKESIARFPLEKTLFVTRCCGVKAKIKRGCAKDLYISSINQNFYKVMEDNGYNYATISDFYGLVYPHQVIDNYNLHPSELTEEQKIKLVDLVKSQLQGKYTFKGGIVVGNEFNVADLQKQHLLLTSTPLFYQEQSLNRFTNPLRYFMVNKAVDFKDETEQLINLNTDKLVLSSLALTKDSSGYALRVYNPTNETVEHAGIVKLAKKAAVDSLNLNSEVLSTLETSTTEFELNDFKPGEIRTYGIYFIK